MWRTRTLWICLAVNLGNIAFALFESLGLGPFLLAGACTVVTAALIRADHRARARRRIADVFE